jgi:hypothetical protein
VIPRGTVSALTAYEHRCAVCGLDVRLDQETLGVETGEAILKVAEGVVAAAVSLG